MTTHNSQPNDAQITVGEYFLARMAQLGVKQVYGVPGDYNLGFLDLIEDHPDLDWVGCCNELNASYAADGYARVSEGGIGCLVTTFGVGELSASNGIAGAHSERVPVVHLVGVPATTLQADHAILHHTLGDGRFDAFKKISEQLTCAQASLTMKTNATEEIDRILMSALTYSRPVYLTLPTDLVYVKVPSSPLKKCLRKTVLQDLEAKPDPNMIRHVVDQISDLFVKSERPIIMLDACCDRFRVQSEAINLVEALQIPVYTTPMGKTVINESHALFGGLYVGDITVSGVKEQVESSDLIICIGTMMSDFNTGNFSYHLQCSARVELHSSETIVQYAHYPDLGFRQLLPLLTKKLSSLPRKVTTKDLNPRFMHKDSKNDDTSEGLITQDQFWPLWAHDFFEPNDVILGETGTSSFGLLDVKFPDGASFLSQILWGSIGELPRYDQFDGSSELKGVDTDEPVPESSLSNICTILYSGWTTGACLGAAQAAAEQGKRTILFIGDGSLQLTVQEISTMIRVGVKPIIVVLNNDGYSIERFIHGMKRKYNDIQPWVWTGILDLFNPLKTTSTASYHIEKYDELVKLLNDATFRKADKIQLVEVKLGKEDAPRALKLQANMTSKGNAY
ncbi:thiamine diphosphate-binding protein [Melampsora americana]|nr:thiamine diphosphate-binding protein [Melampsora americana]